MVCQGTERNDLRARGRLPATCSGHERGRRPVPVGRRREEGGTMNRTGRSARILLALFLLTVSVTAVPAGSVRALGPHRYVATTGSDTSNNCSAMLTPCLTVGHAISQSLAGDTIHIAAGTYVES